MNENLIDLRSDTVTQPSPEMRRAIAEAVVGDDAICVDPTVRKLEEQTAELPRERGGNFYAFGHDDESSCDSNIVFPW